MTKHERVAGSRDVEVVVGGLYRFRSCNSIATSTSISYTTIPIITILEFRSYRSHIHPEIHNMTSPIAQRKLGSSGLEVGAIGSVPHPPFSVRSGDTHRSGCNGLKYDVLYPGSER